MFKWITVTTLAILGGASLAHANDMTGEEFVRKASMSNLFEIESSKLAQERAQDAQVKQFAQDMIADHQKAGEDLKAALAESGLNLQVATSLDEKHRDKLQDLRDEERDDFDEEYMEMQETAHDRAVKLFKNYAKDGDNEALKQFAAKTLPTLQQHEERSDELEDEEDGLW